MRSVFFFNIFFDVADAVAVDVLQLFYDTRPTTAPAETLLRSPSRLCAENPRDVAGLDVAGLVQGATTEQQTVDTALDGAYLDGSYYELQRGTERAARLDWGAPAEDVQGALNALTLTDARVDITRVGANPSLQPDYIIRSSCWTAPSARYRGASPSTTRPVRLLPPLPPTPSPSTCSSSSTPRGRRRLRRRRSALAEPRGHSGGKK